MRRAAISRVMEPRGQGVFEGRLPDDGMICESAVGLDR